MKTFKEASGDPILEGKLSSEGKPAVTGSRGIRPVQSLNCHTILINLCIEFTLVLIEHLENGSSYLPLRAH